MSEEQSERNEEYAWNLTEAAEKLRSNTYSKQTSIVNNTGEFMKDNKDKIGRFIYQFISSNMNACNNNKYEGCIYIREYEMFFIDKFLHDYEMNRNGGKLLKHNNLNSFTDKNGKETDFMVLNFVPQIKRDDRNSNVFHKYHRNMIKDVNVLKWEDSIHEHTKIKIVKFISKFLKESDFFFTVERHQTNEEVIYIILYSKQLEFAYHEKNIPSSTS